MAAEEYHAEFAQKEATIARLTAEADTQKAQHQQKIDTLRTDMEVCLQVWPSDRVVAHSTGLTNLDCTFACQLSRLPA